MKKSKRASPPRQTKVAVAPSSSFPIVGVGASAGGLEAVTLLLRQLPGDARMAPVVVQPLDLGQSSAVTTPLSRMTTNARRLVNPDNGADGILLAMQQGGGRN